MQGMSSAYGQHRVRSRRTIRRRRRRSLLLAGGSMAAAVAGALSLASFTGADLASAAIERAKSFLELMTQRSPGERVKGALTKTKHRHYRVLAARESPAIPPLPLTGTLGELIAPPAELIPGGFNLPEIAEFTPPTGLPPGVTIFSPPGEVVVPCCAVGPPPPGAPPPPGPPPPPPPPGPPPPPPPGPPPPPAVPEPGTWMTMLLGFGLTGWMLRQKRMVERLSPRR
jgi:hypothetical protein